MIYSWDIFYLTHDGIEWNLVEVLTKRISSLGFTGPCWKGVAKHQRIQRSSLLHTNCFVNHTFLVSAHFTWACGKSTYSLIEKK